MKNLLTLFLLLMPLIGYPQKKQLDSLTQEFKKPGISTEKQVDLLTKIGRLIQTNNPDSAISCGNQILKIAQNEEYDKGLIFGNIVKGIGMYRHGRHDSAKKYYEIALSFADKMKDTQRQADIFGNLAILFEKKGEHTKALDYYLKALNSHLVLKDLFGMARDYHNLGILEKKVGRYNNAFSYYDKADSLNIINNNLSARSGILISKGTLYKDIGDYTAAASVLYLASQLADSIGDIRNQANSLVLLGLVKHEQKNYNEVQVLYKKALQAYEEMDWVVGQAGLSSNIGNVYTELENYNDAIYYYKRSVQLAESVNSECMTIYGIQNLGNVFITLNRLDSGLYFANRGIALSKKCGNNSILISAQLNKGEAYRKLGKFTSSEFITKEAIELSIELNFKNSQKNGYKQLSDIYTEAGKFEKALEAYKKFHALSDTLFNEENTRELERLENQFYFDKEKQQIESDKEKQLLSKQAEVQSANLLRNGSIGLLVIIAFFAGFVYNSNKKLQAKNSQISEQKDELQELNHVKEKILSMISHDLKNPLFGIEASLRMIMAGGITKDRFDEHIVQLSGKLNNVSLFLDNLLKWAKNQLTEIHPRKTEFVIQEVIKETLELLQPLASSKQLNFEVEQLSEESTYADEEMVKTALRNVVSNAIKFSYPSGKIRVSCEKTEQGANIKIKDWGTGISKNDQQLIFDQIVSMKKGTIQEAGSGLGLFIAKEFIEKNNGQLKVASEEGQGSEFSILIPGKNNAH